MNSSKNLSPPQYTHTLHGRGQGGWGKRGRVTKQPVTGNTGFKLHIVLQVSKVCWELHCLKSKIFHSKVQRKWSNSVEFFLIHFYNSSGEDIQKLWWNPIYLKHSIIPLCYLSFPYNVYVLNDYKLYTTTHRCLNFLYLDRYFHRFFSKLSNIFHGHFYLFTGIIFDIFSRLQILLSHAWFPENFNVKIGSSRAFF